MSRPCFLDVKKCLYGYVGYLKSWSYVYNTFDACTVYVPYDDVNVVLACALRHSHVYILSNGYLTITPFCSTLKKNIALYFRSLVAVLRWFVVNTLLCSVYTCLYYIGL